MPVSFFAEGGPWFKDVFDRSVFAFLVAANMELAKCRERRPSCIKGLWCWKKPGVVALVCTARVGCIESLTGS